MKIRVVQRSPNVSIGVKLQPLVPAVVTPPPVEIPFFISVSSASGGSPGGEAVSLVHTVTLSKPSTLASFYEFSMTDISLADAGEYVIEPLTSADLSGGVTVSGAVLIVPPGVDSFTITVTVTLGIFIGVRYLLKVLETLALGEIDGF